MMPEGRVPERERRAHPSESQAQERARTAEIRMRELRTDAAQQELRRRAIAHAQNEVAKSDQERRLDGVRNFRRSLGVESPAVISAPPRMSATGEDPRETVARLIAEDARADQDARVRAAARARQDSEARAAAWARQDSEARTRRDARLRAAAQARQDAVALAAALARKAEEHRRAADAERVSLKAALIGRLQGAFESDFLAADDVLAGDHARNLITAQEYEELKVSFVRDWATRHLPEELDLDQAAAVAATGGDIKVVARAGSGKTRTLTSRAVFLQKHCRISPRELLLLAFNKKAAMEMKTRLSQVLGEDLPHVMDFHALAHALVHPQQDLIFDDRPAANLGLSRVVQDVIDDHIRSPEFGDSVRDLMLAHFRDDWERIVDGRIELTIDEFLAYRRALPRESLGGEFVKSFGEREIANTLFEHDIRYVYERSVHWSGVNYRPDFTIAVPARGGVVIEYFGLQGDPDYDEMSAAKRAYWAAREGWTLLEYSPRDLVQGGIEAFREALLGDLRALGVPTRRRSEEEIWQEVRQRAVDRFTETMTGFVGRCRKANLSLDGLGVMIAAHRPASTSEELFLRVGASVYEGYLARLKSQNKDDFDGLMWRAVAEVQNGVTRFVRDRGMEHGDVARLRYVLIDEFQDFSEQFYRLVVGIRQASPSVEFFCVGDDWQAINGFAGADLRFFGDFSSYFSKTSERHIRTNYRSAAPVVRAGNALMKGRGDAAVPHTDRGVTGPAWLCWLDKFSPSPFERERHNGDELTPSVLRIVRRFLDDGLKVVLLSRRNGVRGYVNYSDSERKTVDGLERFLAHIRSFLLEEDRDRVSASTVHRYKGLEQEAVVVLDAIEGSFPLIHPSWVFLRVFGDRVETLEDEERRLFYVAITRARTSLALITDTQRQSPYIGDIQRFERLREIDWSELPEAPSLLDARLEVRVYEAFEIRDQLKDLKYRWEQAGRYWCRTVPEQGFSFDVLLGQPWAQGHGRIVVLSASGAVVHRRTIGAGACAETDRVCG
jgi:DNA helicase IV